MDYNLTEKIIVAVVFRQQFSWYVSDKELWILDYEKRKQRFELAGYPFDLNLLDKRRKNYPILDTNNIADFLENIAMDKVSTQKLRESLIKNATTTTDDWKFYFKPAIYVNFDQKHLYSLYSEGIYFEQYIPENWQGEFEDFYELVPSQERFWINDKDENIFLSF